ncbi:MAG: hypothetical protein ACI9OD_005065 [Limisphaerales bacterium]|jgi:hypothetical protein
MKIDYKIVDNVGGIREYEKYCLADDSDNSEWCCLNDRFRGRFAEYSEGQDYSIPDWHYGVRCLVVDIYNSRMLDSCFVATVLGVISSIRQDAYGKFECAANGRVYGCFLVYPKVVLLEEECVSSGLLNMLGL